MKNPVQTTGWSNRLAFDIALALEGSGVVVADILVDHHKTSSDLTTYALDPVFGKTVENYRQEIRDKGLTFKLKARTQAEELLMTSWDLIHSNDTSAAVKADLIKSIVKWAGYEPKGDVTMDTGGGVSININLGAITSDPSTSTLSAQPLNPVRSKPKVIDDVGME